MALDDEQFLQRRRGIGDPPLDQFAPLRIVANVVDAERDDAALLQIDHRKTARRRIAAQQCLIMAGRLPNGLELGVILVRPKPRCHSRRSS